MYNIVIHTAGVSGKVNLLLAETYWLTYGLHFVNTMESSNSEKVWGCYLQYWLRTCGKSWINSEQNSASLNCSLVAEIELLKYWRTSKTVGMKTLDIIDRSYLLMSSLSLNEFCNWIYNQRTIWNTEISKEN